MAACICSINWEGELLTDKVNRKEEVEHCASGDLGNVQRRERKEGQAPGQY